ncbi:transcriptional regulator [Actinoplanes sp. NPDC049118]|uniref:transcriptional regulator n=1 Tax=Actinoplanes sp. NPDC049118 TaxID=3155769 RepID=UPI0033E2165B
MSSAMVIGLVLHAGHRARFEEAARTLTGVSFTPAVYEHEDQIRDRVAGLLDAGLDGLLLGLVPYARSRDLLPPDLPVAVTRSAALDLALAWSRARGNGWPATPVSIDTFARDTVDEVAAALELDRTTIACQPFDPERPVADVVAFHREHLARTGARYVISVRTGVAAALDGTVAVINALATPGTIRSDLHELALRIRSRRADGRRFAAGVFLIAGPAAGADTDRARAGLLRLLLEAPEFADAWIDDRGRHGIVVLAPAALFEAATRHWAGLPLLAEARAALGVGAVAGFGLGDSARACVALAERAAARAGQDADPGAYLISDNGAVIGPMGASGPPLAYTYREHGGIEALAGRAGLSPATLSRLAAIERSLAGRAISPSDLARHLGITDPSGRRLIRKLGESRLAVGEGSSQLHRRGRPTRLYRLAIAAALDAGTTGHAAAGTPGPVAAT